MAIRYWSRAVIVRISASIRSRICLAVWIQHQMSRQERQYRKSKNLTCSPLLGQFKKTKKSPRDRITCCAAAIFNKDSRKNDGVLFTKFVMEYSKLQGYHLTDWFFPSHLWKPHLKGFGALLSKTAGQHLGEGCIIILWLLNKKYKTISGLKVCGNKKTCYL